MPGAGRRGDKAQVPSDSHGCTGCPHPALGPAVCGSSNVNINGIPALRVGDQGIHGFQIYKTPRFRRGVLVPKSCCS